MRRAFRPEGNHDDNGAINACGAVKRRNPWRYEYSEAGRLPREIDPEGHAVLYGYDRDGRMTSTTDGNGNVTTIAYRPAHSSGNPEATRLERTVYPTFTRERRFDSRNRLVSEDDIDSESVHHLTSYAYDRLGNLRATTNPDGKISELSYDALNRLVARALTDVRRVVLIGRDRWDQEVGVTDPRGNTTTLAFDKLGRRVSETKPRGGVTSFTYDEVGNVRRITDPRQMSVESLYDDAGRKQYEKMWPSPEATTPSKTITYTYNARGDLTGWDDGEMSGTFDIDPLGREAASSVDYGPFTKGSSTTYFRNGLQKTFTGPDEVTYGYTYDGGGRLRGIAIPGEGSIIYNEYLWTQPTQVTLPGGTVQEYEYDDLLRMTRAYSRDPAGNTIMDQHYQRDINGRVTRKETEEGYYQYGYDDSYQLISVESDIMPNESYEYDLAGNRYPTDAPERSQWEYDADDQLVSSSLGILEYDLAGNQLRPVSTPDIEYSYNERGEVRGTEQPPIGTVTHRYDPQGRRLEKDRGTEREFFYYRGATLVATLAADGAVVESFGYADDHWSAGALPVTRKDADTNRWQYVHRDHRATMEALTDGEGRIQATATYSAFGRAFQYSAGRHFPFGIGGQYVDAEGGAHQNWHRSYDADSGRFLSPDPVGRLLRGHGAIDIIGSSSYAYAWNDPINNTDPTGLICLTRMTRKLEVQMHILDVRHGEGTITPLGMRDGGCLCLHRSPSTEIRQLTIWILAEDQTVCTDDCDEKSDSRVWHVPVLDVRFEQLRPETDRTFQAPLRPGTTDCAEACWRAYEDEP